MTIGENGGVEIVLNTANFAFDSFRFLTKPNDVTLRITALALPILTRSLNSVIDVIINHTLTFPDTMQSLKKLGQKQKKGRGTK